MTRYDFTVTFESPDTAPPDTVRGTCTGGSWATGAAHAVQAAKKARPGRQFKSLLVLLSRSEHQDAREPATGTVKRPFPGRKSAPTPTDTST